MDPVRVARPWRDSIQQRPRVLRVARGGGRYHVYKYVYTYVYKYTRTTNIRSKHACIVYTDRATLLCQHQHHRLVGHQTPQFHLKGARGVEMIGV